MSSRASSFGCTGLLVGLLVAAMVATLGAELAGPGVPRGGALDVSPQGRRLGFRLLEELGHEPDVWAGDVLDLAESPVELLWLGELPRGFRLLPTLSPSEDPFELAPTTEPVDERALRGLADFVARGGDLVVPVRGSGASDLAERLLDLESGLLRGLLRGRVGRSGLGTGLREDGEEGRELVVEVRAAWGEWPEDHRLGNRVRLLEDPPPGLDVDPLPGWSDHVEGEPSLAVALSTGAGRVVLLSEDAFATNALLPEGDHALVLVRLIEHLGRRTWFDQTMLPSVTGSWLGYLLRPPLWPLTLAALVLGALAAWRSAPRRGFPLEERIDEDPAPLERARGRAGLLVRARRVELLAAELTAGVRGRLGGDDAAFEERLRVAAAGDESWLLAARRALGFDEARTFPKTTAELQELGATLAAIERRIQEA